MKRLLEHVTTCTRCYGSGFVMGLTMKIYCEDCHGIGLLEPEINDPESTTLAIQLGNEVRRLAELLRQERRITQSLRTPAQQAFEQSRYVTNGKGPGGSCFTGD